MTNLGLYCWEELKKVAAKIKFVSIEPLLENFTKFPDEPDWVIIGGESGYNSGRYKYRVCRIGWIYISYSPFLILLVRLSRFQ